MEKKGKLSKGEQIKNKIVITNLEETPLKTSDKEEAPAILIKFNFGLGYASAGNLEFKGHVIYYDARERDSLRRDQYWELISIK